MGVACGNAVVLWISAWSDAFVVMLFLVTELAPPNDYISIAQILTMACSIRNRSPLTNFTVGES